MYAKLFFPLRWFIHLAFYAGALVDRPPFPSIISSIKQAKKRKKEKFFFVKVGDTQKALTSDGGKTMSPWTGTTRSSSITAWAT
jgi:hypothetical protein